MYYPLKGNVVIAQPTAVMYDIVAKSHLKPSMSNNIRFRKPTLIFMIRINVGHINFQSMLNL